MQKVMWWESATTLPQLVVQKNKQVDIDIDKKNLYVNHLLEDKFFSTEEHKTSLAENETFRIKISLEDFLRKYELTQGNQPTSETINKIAAELGCPGEVVTGIVNKEGKGASMSESNTIEIKSVEAVVEQPKKKRGRPPGSVNKNKLAKDTDNLSMNVAAASSMVNIDGETLMDISRNLRDLSMTFEKLSGKKTQ